MAVRKAGLGRGLEALLPSGEGGQGFSVLPLGAISPNPQQPRARFDDGALENLAASIREVGVLQPIVVRQIGLGEYQLVAGERRWRAAQIVGLEEIPAIVRDGDDASGLTEALIENLQREDLTPLEEAGAYRQLMEDFGLTHEEVAVRVGKSRSGISNTLRLLQLPAVIQGLLEAGELSAGHCRALLAIDDTRYAEHIARRAAAEGWSVRRVEEAVRARSGETDPKPTTGPRIADRPAEILALEERLTERLGSTVRIDYGAKGGKILIRFGSLDDLERVYRSLLGT
ncbi:MAG: ParB/RepB/Spo0J family partition protein [Actinobacteria bacterium]|nr:ParB/RepB/Spo0J family partition protein [Actinomycetota bacterium]